MDSGRPKEDNVMQDSPQHSRSERGLLDTLAQSRTRIESTLHSVPIVVNGLGSDLKDVGALMGRAKRKTITQAMVLGLIDVATKKKKPDRIKSYWNAYHCQSRIITNSDRLHGKYCKNRFCTLCCCNRKATLINKYLPYLQTWEDCHFVTLTVKAIPAKELTRYFKGMLGLLAKIIEKHRKRGKRGKGIALEGIRSLECNFNPKTKTYNPHFHILVRSRQMAEVLKEEWLARFPKKHAHPCAQHIRRVDDMTKDLIEIIKYGSKIFTEPDVTKKGVKRQSQYIYVSALDNILTAMAGRRIFDRFGFNLPNSGQSRNTKIGKVLLDYAVWTFKPPDADWTNAETGEALTGFRISQDLRNILAFGLNLESQ
jgi:hypothetical protein